MENTNVEMIKKSIQFYKSRNFSEEEMIADISLIMKISKGEVIKVLKAMKE